MERALAAALALPHNLFRPPHPLGDGGGSGGGAHAGPLGQCRSWRPVRLRLPPVNLPVGLREFTQPLIEVSAPSWTVCAAAGAMSLVMSANLFS